MKVIGFVLLESASKVKTSTDVSLKNRKLAPELKLQTKQFEYSAVTETNRLETENPKLIRKTPIKGWVIVNPQFPVDELVIPL